MQVLSSHDSMNQMQIIVSTGLSERTIKYALKKLISDKVVIENTSFADMRRKTYKIRGEQYG